MGRGIKRSIPNNKQTDLVKNTYISTIHLKDECYMSMAALHCILDAEILRLDSWLNFVTSTLY